MSTAATPIGNCHKCGGVRYANLVHYCPTAKADAALVSLPKAYWRRGSSDVAWDPGLMRAYLEMHLRAAYGTCAVNPGVALFLLDAWEHTAHSERNAEARELIALARKPHFHSVVDVFNNTPCAGCLQTRLADVLDVTLRERGAQAATPPSTAVKAEAVSREATLEEALAEARTGRRAWEQAYHTERTRRATLEEALRAETRCGTCRGSGRASCVCWDNQVCTCDLNAPCHACEGSGFKARSAEGRAALASLREQGDQNGIRVCWLVERGQSEHQMPTVWWVGDPDATSREGENWTQDAHAATSFQRQEAAAAVIARLFTPVVGEPTARATEHAFSPLRDDRSTPS